MPIITSKLSLKTKGNTDIIDITSEVEKELMDTNLGSGIVTIFLPGATGGITTIEYESGLIEDIKSVFEKLVPRWIEYKHNLAWQDGNGHSHIRASLLGPSLTIPFVQKKLLLGRWQQIIFIDFDVRPRSRELILQFIGGSKR